MPDDDRIEIEKLVLIEGDIPSQRLVVTWPKVFLEYRDLLDCSPAELSTDHPFTFAWGRVAGVDLDDIEKRAPVLFENGLLYDNGTTSDTALGYVKSRLISEMPRIDV